MSFFKNIMIVWVINMENTNQTIVNIKRSVIEKIFNKMNSEQQKAIFHVNGPLLILAGAGSGKTTVIVNRILFLIEYGDCYYNNSNTHLSLDDIDFLSNINKDDLSDDNIFKIKSLVSYNKVKPWNILAITFTNKAANELKERLYSILGDKSNDLNTGTFHSICARILRRYIDRIGYDNKFTIYDTDDSIRVLKECFNELNINDKLFPIKSVLNEIGRAKDKLLSYKEYLEIVKDDYRKSIIANIYQKYQLRLENANALDFDDIIYLTVKLFSNNNDILKYYQNRYRYIMVDEYQDTNHAQYKLISLLAGSNGNVCVVGDDDQSIYSFRGANIENILNFENQFNNALVIRLEQNYRSSQNILDAANQVIKNNHDRKGKNLWTSSDKGEKIDLYKGEDEQLEAEYITKKIVDNIKNNKKYSDHAILYRMNAQSANIERFFVKSGIPYKIIGGTKFFERKEIKDIISYLSVINNSNDIIRLKRIINEPKRGIGDTTVSLIQQLSEDNNISMYEIINNYHKYSELNKKANALDKFRTIINNLSDLVNDINLSDFIDELMEKTGYRDYLNTQGKEGLNRLENINELKSTIMKYELENENPSLSGFLEEVSLYTDLNDLNQNEDSVILMTIHSSKGLEFDTVFLVGLEEGIFPGYQAINSPVELEEERRLAYVGITRAKRKLYLTNVKLRMLFGNVSRNSTSRFIKEIPEHLLQINDETINKSNYLNINKNISKNNSVNIAPEVKMASEKVSNKSNNFNYNIGDTVSHNVFGKGIIVSMTPMANDILVEVAFDKVGTKKIMSNFAKFKKL